MKYCNCTSVISMTPLATEEKEYVVYPQCIAVSHPAAAPQPKRYVLGEY